MSNKYQCDFCKQYYRLSGMIPNKRGLICSKCRVKRGETKETSQGPLLCFEKEMEKVHKVYGRKCNGGCSFSKFLWGQEMIIRGKTYKIKKQVYFPKELIGLKFKLNPERLEVIEVEE